MKIPCIYLHKDDAGEIIYVGRSMYPRDRMLSHSCQSEWFSLVRNIQILPMESKLIAAAEERRLIGELKPKYNKKCKGD